MRENDFRAFFSEVSTLIAKLMDKAEGDDHEKLSELNRSLLKIEEEEIRDDSKIKDEFWTELESFIDALESNNKLSKVIKRLEVPPEWDYWGYLHEIPSEHGYSKKHVALRQGPSNPSGRHVYKGRPSQIKWRLTPIVEKGEVRFYIANAPINEVDAVCSVPSIKHGISVYRSSKRILNPKLKLDEWQREIDSSRIVQISGFLNNKDNSFANSCMIFSPNHNSIEWEVDGNDIARAIKIDFQFLKQDPTNQIHLTDHHGSVDLRPLKIIDGQHRVRGGMRSQRGHKLSIPIILFPPKLGNSGAAKFFAEINTLAEPLHVLHEIFMRHKFSLTSNKDERKFGPFNHDKSTYRDRANRLSYEAAAFVNVNSESMCKLIQILDENPETNFVISADMWIKFAHKWFMTKGPYPPPPPNKHDESEIFYQEICNYFDAFMEITNAPWKPDKPRWRTYDILAGSDKGGNRPYIQYRTTIRSLLIAYPIVVNSIRDSGYSKQLISQKRFEKRLRVLGNIDWLNRDIKTHYIGTSEYPWKSLTQWMLDCLSRGEKKPFSKEDVMSESICSKRGKGILSKPDPGKIEFADPKQTWPEPDKPLELVVTRPINAMRGCEGRLQDSDFQYHNAAARCRIKGTAGSNETYTFKIHHWSQLNQFEELVFTCLWGNAIDKFVQSTITLKRP